jgi:hypothetical protein
MIKKLTVLLLAIAPVCSANYNYTETKSQTWEFAPGGRVELHLKGGDIHVVPAPDSSHIVIRYTMESEHKDFARKVRPLFEVTSSSALLRFASPTNGSVDVDLEVPTQTSILIRVKGGDVTISGIEGDQDIRTIGGDIDLDLPVNEKFYRVDASTHVGEIHNSPFGRPRGWLGSKVRFRGEGKYRLHAHTFAGDIRFSTLTASR